MESSTKRCCTCKLTKPKEDFCRNKIMYDGINHQCRTCNRIVYEKYKPKRATYIKVPCECGREVTKSYLKHHKDSLIHITLMVKLRESIP